jgi:hypothetical protein
VNLTENHVAVLTALRAATVLKREPKTLTPDGYERWHSLSELADEGRFDLSPFDATLAALSSAARGLYKQKLLTVRTVHTVVRYALTHEGFRALAAHEAEAGLSDVAAARMELEQAREDVKQARRRERAAEERLLDAQAARAARSRP